MKSKDYYEKGWGSFNERVNSRRFWRIASMSNSFKNYISFHYRVLSMQMFYRRCDEVIKTIYKLTGQEYELNEKRKAKAQISVCYTPYPAGVGIQAAIGATAWLQYKNLKSTIQAPANPPAGMIQFALDQQVDLKSFTEVYQHIYRSINERLVYQELKLRGIQEVEAYRFVIANYNHFRLESLPEIIHSAVMLGDLLPGMHLLNIHPVSNNIMKEVLNICLFFCGIIEKAKIEDLSLIGNNWTEALLKTVCQFLPSTQETDHPGKEENETCLATFNHNGRLPSPNEDFAGFNKPKQPTLDEIKDPSKLIQNLLNACSRTNNGCSGSAGQEKIPEEIKSFIDQIDQTVKTMMSSSGQDNKFEDLRSDILLDLIMNAPYQTGPIEGSNSELNSVEADLGNGIVVKGNVFEKRLTPSFDEGEIENLIQLAEPLTLKMKKNIFPNVEEVAYAENLKTSGMIDNSRLSDFMFSDAIFKRIVHKKENNKKGRPVVLLACDSSGSMGKDKMQMLKLLTVAWIGSTLQTSVQVIAGMYNETNADKNRYGPLVRWICHPTKTIASSKKQAIRTIASLPDSGDGSNPDALALAFLLQEAELQARGKQIYLIHITDTQWCNSFQQGLSAEDEVTRVVNRKKELLGKRLHYTLVGISTTSGGKVEKLVADKFIPISASELTNPLAAAGKVGEYVSACLKERNQKFVTN